MNKTEITAWLLPMMKAEVKDLSTLIYIADQECVLAFYTDGGLLRIPTPGDGLKLIKAVVSALDGRN